MIRSVARHPFLVPAVLLGTFSTAALAEPAKPPAATADALLNCLTRVPPQCQVLQTSSHNKMGHNGDANSPMYIDTNGDGVIFDAAGPGCVRSIWGTAFPAEAVMKFYFDGEKEPHYKINQIDFFKGKHPDFPMPLASYDVRGQYEGLQYAGNCFVPIPFEKSLKISIAGGILLLPRTLRSLPSRHADPDLHRQGRSSGDPRQLHPRGRHAGVATGP